MKDYFDKIFKKKSKILVVMSHPDDAEIYCGGTISRLTSEGKEVRVVKMTDGNKGSRQEEVSEAELAETRKSENKKSMEVLGVKPEDNVLLGIGDGEVENNLKTIEKVVRQIREFKPDIIITHNPEDVVIRFDKNVNWINHRDHMTTGLVTTYAAYPYSRDLLFFPEHFSNGKLESHTVTEFLYVDYYDHIDETFIDVTDYIENKIDSIAAHKSQYTIEDATESAEFFTKIERQERRYERFRYVIAD